MFQRNPSASTRRSPQVVLSLSNSLSVRIKLRILKAEMRRRCSWFDRKLIEFATDQIFNWSIFQLIELSTDRTFNWSNFQLIELSTDRFFNWSNFQLIKFSTYRIFNLSNFQLIKLSTNRIPKAVLVLHERPLSFEPAPKLFISSKMSK